MPASEAAAFLEASNEDPEVRREAARALAARNDTLAEEAEEEAAPAWPQLGKRVRRLPKFVP